jgi:AAA domain
MTDNYADPGDLDSMPDYSADDAYEDALNLRRDVAAELHKLRVRKAAQEALRAESEPPAPPFDAGTLGEILARPADPPMRVDGLIPWESSALLVAQRKTGKTTMLLNLARSLLTGEDLLGALPSLPNQRFPPTPSAQRMGRAQGHREPACEPRSASAGTGKKKEKAGQAGRQAEGRQSACRGWCPVLACHAIVLSVGGSTVVVLTDCRLTD